MRGRHTRNLYRSEGQFSEAILSRTVGEVRHDLDLDRPIPPPTATDFIAFAFWSIFSTAYLLALPVALVYLVALVR